MCVCSLLAESLRVFVQIVCVFVRSWKHCEKFDYILYGSSFMVSSMRTWHKNLRTIVNVWVFLKIAIIERYFWTVKRTFDLECFEMKRKRFFWETALYSLEQNVEIPGNEKRENFVLYFSKLRPQIRQDYPLNLSILISGGKETNKDFLSNGERKGKSPALNLASHGCHDMWRLGRNYACVRYFSKSLLNGAIAHGGC